MAVGTKSDFTIYEDQVHGAFVERIVENTDAFNAISQGGIRLVNQRRRGDYGQTSFWQNTSSLVSRRDITSVSAATDIAVSQDEFISVKLNRTIGPIAQTLDAFRKIQQAANAQSFSFLIGTQVAKAVAQNQLNGALTGLTAALNNQSDLKNTATNTMTTDDLVDALANMGDQANRVVVWVMHSKPFYDLVKSQISDNVTNVADVNVATATPVTLNRPVIITDDAALKVVGSPTGDDDYYTLGLVEGGAVVEDSEEETIQTEIVTGLDNLAVRLQGEFAFNLGLRGFKWDTTNGGVNPTDSALGTGSNWDKIAADVKDLSGVLVQSK